MLPNAVLKARPEPGRVARKQSLGMELWTIARPPARIQRLSTRIDFPSANSSRTTAALPPLSHDATRMIPPFCSAPSLIPVQCRRDPAARQSVRRRPPQLDVYYP